jgi:threonine aldolase
MRFLSAPWAGVLKDGAWLRHAKNANTMAEYLEASLRDLPNVKQLFPRQANAVFVELPRAVIEGLWRKGWKFYTFIGQGGCRLMCSWDTQPEDVAAFVADLKALLQ